MNQAMQVVVATAALVLAGSRIGAQENVISGKSKVSFTGRLHAQYYTSSVEGAGPNNSFTVRRARLAAEFGNPRGTMKGKVQYDLASGSPKLKDGYVDLLLTRTLELRLGQYKKPFSLWELTSTKRAAVIERGDALIGSAWKATNNIITGDGLYAGRDIGLMLHGRMGGVSYRLGVFNGNGDNNKGDDDSGKLLAARLVYSLTSGLAVGASFASRTVSDYPDPAVGDTTRTAFQAYGIDLEYGIRHDVTRTGPWVQVEFLYGANPVYGDDASFSGLTVVGSYNLRPEQRGTIYSLRPAFRLDYAKRYTDGDTGNFLLTPGLDIFLDRYNRVQVNLDVDRSQADGAGTEFGLRVQFQQII